MFPFLSKIFKKLPCATLDSYLKLNNVLCANQFGFHKNSNTPEAIIKFFDYVYSSLHRKQNTIAVYLDCSKAFDTVNNNIFMIRLLYNGIRGVMQSWFKSYLSIRKQYVSIKTAVPLCQTLHLVFCKAWCWAQYFSICIWMTCVDPQIR